MSRNKTAGKAESALTENDLISQLLSVSRYVVTETLLASAIHGMRHRLYQARRNIDHLLQDQHLRENRLLLDILTEVGRVLTGIETDIRTALNFVRDVRDEGSFSCDAHVEVGRTINVWTAYLQQRYCSLKLKLEAHNTHVKIPPEHLQEIISALLVNSVEAGSRVVSITTKDKKQWHVSEIFKLSHGLEILVVDNGIGLVENVTERIFEPSYTTKPKSRGIGLGLFIARSLARKAGGELSYIGPSTKKRGAAFSIALPLHESKP